jgi:hypothetical protein
MDTTIPSEIPEEIRKQMEQDMDDAQEGLWWMIEHPTLPHWWNGFAWVDDWKIALHFTTQGHAENEITTNADLLWPVDYRITQHGPA